MGATVFPADSYNATRHLPRPLWIGLAAATLLIVAAVLRIGLPIYRQQAAIQEIENRGGSVRSYAFIPSWMLSVSLRLSKAEQEQVIVRDVDEVYLSGNQIDDSALEVLNKLPNVRHLDLTLSHVTDRGIADLARLSHLETLDLSGTEVTDAGLVHLRSLKKLHRLYLVSTAITDDCINDLRAALPGLQVRN